jgi:dolichol-phosphate mannosyltransferase
MNRSLSILMLAFNERGNLAGALRDIQDAATVLDDYEIIIVDDGSTDGTGPLADRLAARHPDVRAYHHAANRGLRAGYETGLEAARMPYVVWLPADREIEQRSLLGIFEQLGEADIVAPYHGTPERRPWPRRLLTWISTTEINVLLGRRLRYWQGPAVYPTHLARALPRTVPGFFFCAEMLACAMSLGLSYVEVPLEHRERTYGVSKAVSWRRIRDAEIAVLGFFWRFRVCGEARRRLRLDFASP